MTKQAPILITGAAQRLGLAIALDLLAQGYDVIVTYRSEKPGLERLASAGATLVQVDFNGQQDIDKLINWVSEGYQSLRGIIHNASDWLPNDGHASQQVIFERMMNIHANVPYQLNLAFASLLATNEQADIIHMTDYVQDKGSKKHIAYAASKAALHNMTLSFAASLAPQVKVNSIAPALLMFNEHDSQDYRNKALKKSLLQTCPGEQEAVDAVNYLLNSRYITGRCQHLDGGRHLK